MMPQMQFSNRALSISFLAVFVLKVNGLVKRFAKASLLKDVTSNETDEKCGHSVRK